MAFSNPPAHNALRRIPYALHDTFAAPPAALRLQSSRLFSSSVPHAKRPDRNRGVSPLRRTGLRQKLSVDKYPLPVPKPISREERAERIEVDPQHGLWQFFHDKQAAIVTPLYHSEHGRAWTAAELREKGWEDLHALWWKCMKEQSRINTANAERKRLRAGVGDKEAQKRSEEVSRTRSRIRQVLIERWYSWEEALKLAREEETIDLSGEGPLYDSYQLRNETETTTGGEALLAQDGGIDRKDMPAGDGKPRNITM